MVRRKQFWDVGCFAVLVEQGGPTQAGGFNVLMVVYCIVIIRTFIYFGNL